MTTLAAIISGKSHVITLNGVMPVDGFWRPEEIPPFTGQKKGRHTFVVASDRLKEKHHSSKTFKYQSGNIQAFFDHSDYKSDASSNSDFTPAFLNLQLLGYLLLVSSWAPNTLSNVPAARKWIQQSKKFPEGLPLPSALHELCKVVLTVPKDILSPLLPTDEMPVSKLWNFKMALVQLISGQPLSFFQTAFPINSVDTTAPIPPKDFMDIMMVAFGQALLDGKQSIHDLFSQGKLLPLWMIKFWQELHHVRAIRDKWLQANKWLGSRMFGDGLQTFRSARIQLDCLSWNKLIMGSAASGLQMTLNYKVQTPTLPSLIQVSATQFKLLQTGLIM
ncbi:uncharacterized protein BJ212DRAFT_1299108 [Suillus subaureus]|uniref:Uncharacterized protein n=1 Tax=Suillus subaureus TaxID=48587 RepID=A0A9P7EC32_9AGAM|nr:uncharacterized protein BJ212DRAFT_1299108 [Suillus subaureus]KAG1817561.1 hypothetical protein BJ212DRAFT_1299108 [Suillus subaureus]